MSFKSANPHPKVEIYIYSVTKLTLFPVEAKAKPLSQSTCDFHLTYTFFFLKPMRIVKHTGICLRVFWVFFSSGPYLLCIFCLL